VAAPLTASTAIGGIAASADPMPQAYSRHPRRETDIGWQKRFMIQEFR
jgi:hypothetical protein